MSYKFINCINNSDIPEKPNGSACLLFFYPTLYRSIGKLGAYLLVGL